MSGDDTLKVVIEMVDNLVAPLKSAIAKARSIVGGASAKMMSGVQSVTKSHKELGLEAESAGKKSRSAGDQVHGAMTDVKSGIDMAIMAYGMLQQAIKGATDESDKYKLSVYQLSFQSKNIGFAKKEMDALIAGQLTYGGVLEDQMGLYKTLRQSGVSLKGAFSAVAASEDMNAIGKKGDAIGKWAAHVQELRDANKNLKTVSGADFTKFMKGAGFTQDDIKSMFDISKTTKMAEWELNKAIGTIPVETAANFFTSKIIKVLDKGTLAGASAAATQGATIGMEMARLNEAMWGWMRDVDTKPITDALKAMTALIKDINRQWVGDGLEIQMAMKGLVRVMWLVGATVYGIAAIVMVFVVGIEVLCEMLEELAGVIFPALGAAAMGVFHAFEWLGRGIVWLVTTIVNGIADGLAAFIMFFYNIGDSIGEFLSGLVTYVKQTASRMYNQMYNFGANMLQGLWDGMKAIGPNLYSWFNEHILGYGKAVEVKMEMHSPSKLMGRRGANISKGLVGGAVEELDKSAPKFASATEAAFQPANKSGSGGAPATGASRGTYAVNFGDVYIAAEVSKDIIEKLMPELRKAIHYEFEGMGLAAGV